MIFIRQFGMQTALCALSLALGSSAAAVAAPTRNVQRSAVIRPAASAHSVAVLHNFAGPDGSAPVGNLDLAISISRSSVSRTLYGVTEGGGSQSSGTIYSLVIGPSTFSSLYSFTGGNDGAIPVAGLANNDTNYFPGGGLQAGVTTTGGSAGNGTLFAVSPSGALTVVHTFTGGADGSAPAGRITRFVDGNYYGTTSSGGAYGFGTVFRVSPAGAFSTIYTFTGGNDGGSPQAGLALDISLRGDDKLSPSTMQIASGAEQHVSPYLYGTTATGAAFGSGTLFRISPAGKLQTLYAFTGGNDGGVPAAKLTTDFRGNLYGSTSVGGSAGNGVLFVLAANQTKPQVIYDFGNGATGASPQAELTLALNGNLYGSTTAGGASGIYGTVFEISSNGRAFADIHDFQSTDGANPQGALVDGGDGNLYGTALNGGAFGAGVVYAIAE